MERLVCKLLLVLILGIGPAWAQEPNVIQGLITANDVDVTADDGSLLPNRLNVGDTVYVVVNPKEKKKDWVRISRSLNDEVGIGWVQAVHIRTVPFGQYTSDQAPAEAPAVSAPTPQEEPIEELPIDPLQEDQALFSPAPEEKYSKVAILPFTLSDPSDSTGVELFNMFSTAIRNDGSFQVQSSNFPLEDIDKESPGDLDRVVSTQNLDGVFVGELSSPIGGSRLLQIKFYGKDRKSFVLEKVTRVPEKGNAQKVIDEFVTSIVESLSAS